MPRLFNEANSGSTAGTGWDMSVAPAFSGELDSLYGSNGSNAVLSQDNGPRKVPDRKGGKGEFYEKMLREYDSYPYERDYKGEFKGKGEWGRPKMSENERDSAESLVDQWYNGSGSFVPLSDHDSQEALIPSNGSTQPGGWHPSMNSLNHYDNDGMNHRSSKDAEGRKGKDPQRKDPGQEQSSAASLPVPGSIEEELCQYAFYTYVFNPGGEPKPETGVTLMIHDVHYRFQIEPDLLDIFTEISDIDAIDYIYLPMTIEGYTRGTAATRNKGYCFVHFSKAEVAEKFAEKVLEYEIPDNCKGMHTTLAKFQGVRTNLVEVLDVQSKKWRPKEAIIRLRVGNTLEPVSLLMLRNFVKAYIRRSAQYRSKDSQTQCTSTRTTTNPTTTTTTTPMLTAPTTLPG